MKRQLSIRNVAKEMTEIMLEHLDSLPENERKKKIEEGNKETSLVAYKRGIS